jgi:hypothetical protein
VLCYFALQEESATSQLYVLCDMAVATIRALAQRMQLDASLLTAKHPGGITLPVNFYRPLDKEERGEQCTVQHSVATVAMQYSAVHVLLTVAMQYSAAHVLLTVAMQQSTAASSSCVPCQVFSSAKYDDSCCWRGTVIHHSN